MMYKIIDIDPFFRDTDELSVKMIDFDSFEKNASALGHHVPEEIVSFIKGLVPKEDKIYAHVIALSADDFYGCFVDGTKIMLSDMGEKNISDVKIGDYVLTHKLRHKKVINTFKRKTSELIYSINPLGIDPVKCTGNHPFYVVKKDAFVCKRDKYKRCMPGNEGKLNICKRGKSCSNGYVDMTPSFVRADELSLGDFIMIPRNNNLQRKDLSLLEARLLGYYASEGSILKYRVKNGNIVRHGIKLDININEISTIGKDIEFICNNLGYKFNGYDIRKYREDNSFSYHIYSKKLAKICLEYIGEYSRELFVSDKLLNQSNDIVSEFLSSYVDGDGTIQSLNRISITTASENLSYGIQKLFFKLGIPASRFKYKPTENDLNKAPFHYRITCTEKVSSVLKGFKVSLLKKPKQCKCWSFCDDSFIYLPIRSIELSEFDGYVYNLEVEEDNTYIANNIIVHNSNRNGDAFKESDLLGMQDEVEASKNPDPYTNVTLPRYKTFLSAHFFKHHINKNPEESYGRVVCVAYNMIMHRVELVIEVDRKKNPDFVEKVENGKPAPLSMGTKVPFDICSICHNKAKNRKEYCIHAKHFMNQILPDGRQVKVYNTKPRFFDISDVLVPADEQSYALSKVASLIDEFYDPREFYEEDDNGMEKLMSAFKSGEMDKKITGITIGDAVKNVNTKLMDPISSEEPDFSDEDIESASSHPLKNILSTLTNMGMVLKPSEHRKIIIIKINNDPDFLKESSSLDVDFQDPAIYNIFKKYAEKRSCYTDFLIKRASVLSNNKAANNQAEIVTDHISDCLYGIYRNSINNLDAEKVAENIDRNFNLESFFEKSAVHWSVPAAAIPLASSYLYGAHQQYKRRFEGEPLTPFQEYVSKKPGQVGLATGAGIIAGKKGISELLKRYKFVKR